MISKGRLISAHGAPGKISQRAYIHHNSNTSCLEPVAGKSGSPQHYVMGSLLSWQRCGNWNCVFVWLEAAACVDRMFLTLGSWMGLAINTQSGVPSLTQFRFGVLCRLVLLRFWSYPLIFIFPQDLEEVLYCTLERGHFLKGSAGQINLPS